MSFLVDLIPARYRKALYGALGVAATVVAVLGQLRVIPVDGAAQIGAVIVALTNALAHANTNRY